MKTKPLLRMSLNLKFNPSFLPGWPLEPGEPGRQTDSAAVWINPLDGARGHPHAGREPVHFPERRVRLWDCLVWTLLGLPPLFTYKQQRSGGLYIACGYVGDLAWKSLNDDNRNCKCWLEYACLSMYFITLNQNLLLIRIYWINENDCDIYQGSSCQIYLTGCWMKFCISHFLETVPLISFQILFMVGRGFLRPDMSYLRSDMPKPIRRILDDCIKYNRDDRPLFQQVREDGSNLFVYEYLKSFF